MNIKMAKQIIKRNFKRIIYGTKADSESYIKYLKKIGVQIGRGTIIYSPQNTIIDTQNPYLLEIGSNVRITSGVVILTHDYSWSVIAGVYGDCLGAVAPTTIGNNVFIGMNAIILRGVHIGDNCIIGAGSVVSSDCETNSVYAGNPARKVCTIEEFYKKRKVKNLEEAKSVCRIYYEKTKKKAGIKELREYQFLFNSIEDIGDKNLQKLMNDTGYMDKCIDYLKNHEPMYGGIDELLNECMQSEH